MNSIYNFHQVSGILACAGQPTEEQLKQLAGERYQVIINLAPNGGKSSLADEAASVKTLGITYCHIPVVFNNPQQSELDNFIDVMNLHSNKKVLVHCVANYRASAFTGLYLFKTGKLDKTQAQSFIEDVWQPDDDWQQFIDEVLG